MKRREFLSAMTAAALSGIAGGCSRKNAGNPRPNILFAIADDASFPNMGAYGCSWIKTPGFDRVAREGILFNRCYTPNAKCAPSRSCILTGRNSWQLEEAANHWCYFPQKFKTYPEALSENGYHVGHTAKGWGPGIAGEKDGKPRQLAGKAYNSKKTDPPAQYMSNSDYAGNFEEFLLEKPDGMPFCFWYGGQEPHRRYEYGVGIKKAGKKISDIDKVYSFWPDIDTVKTDLLDYAFEIEYFDLHLQRMLALLEERGELDNTLIIVTADNGMPFPRVKGQEYEYSNHLPLAIMWKNGIKNPGRANDDFVSFIDFTPTYLELARINREASGMQPITGNSLTDILYSDGHGAVIPARNHVLIGKERHDIGRPKDAGYPIRGIVKGDFLYLVNFEISRWPAGNPETGYLNVDGSPTKTEILNLNRSGKNKHYWKLSFGKRDREELYDIRKDPECVTNLAGENEFRQIAAEMQEQLFNELKVQGDPRMFGQGHIFDEYVFADTNSANFYERYMKREKPNSGWVEPTDFEE